MSQQKSHSHSSWALLVLLALIWGGSFLSIRIALDEVGPLTSVAHRTFWAMLILWGVVLMRGHSLPRDLRSWTDFFGVGMLNNVIPFTLMAWGQLFIASGLTSIFNAATAIFGALAAALFFADERISLRKGIGVALGFCGVITAVGADALRGFDIKNLAQLAVIAGTISYALAGVWARKRLTQMPPELAAAGMLSMATLVTVPLAWVLEGPITLRLQTDTMLAIFYYAAIATAGAYLLYYRILAVAGSSNVMLVTLLIPPVAITLGAVARDESLPANAYAGFALLALGMLVLDGRVLRALRRPR